VDQKSQPIADHLPPANYWVPKPIYPQVNDPHPGDSTFVSSFGTPTGDTFEVDMDPIGPPVSGGAQKLTVRIRWLYATDVSVWISLLQGNALIATREVEAPGTGSFAD
jgi:hypothetical protein